MIERGFIQQNLRKIQIEDYLKKELRHAGFTKAEIVKTPIATRVIVYVTRPGLAIGKKGKNIRAITEELEKRFGIENPQIEVAEITEPALDAKACVDRIAALIERGYSWRSVVYRVMEDAIASGAQGIEIVLKGVLAGKGTRKAKERVARGYMKKAGEQAYLVDYAKGVAVPKPGAIGIRVRIIKPKIIFPDKIDIRELLKEKAAKTQEAEENNSEEKASKEQKSKAEEVAEEKGMEKVEADGDIKTSEQEVSEEVQEESAESKETKQVASDSKRSVDIEEDKKVEKERKKGKGGKK